MAFKSKKPNEQYLTIAQLQELLQIGRSHAYQIARDELPVYRVGRLLRVRREDVEAWLERKLERNA